VRGAKKILSDINAQPQNDIAVQLFSVSSQHFDTAHQLTFRYSSKPDNLSRGYVFYSCFLNFPASIQHVQQNAIWISDWAERVSF
jgi:hypothetical protein